MLILSFFKSCFQIESPLLIDDIFLVLKPFALLNAYDDLIDDKRMNKQEKYFFSEILTFLVSEFPITS